MKAVWPDLRRAHVNGGAGVLISGLVWLMTGLIWQIVGPKTAIFALFIGGIAIAPLAQLVSRLVFKAPPSGPGKRLEWIALATVPILLAGFYLGWMRIDSAPGLAIPVVAVAVGVRYLIFPIMFGLTHFIVLGGAFIVTGWLALRGFAFPIGNMAIALGLAELACAWLLCRDWVRAARAP